MPLPPKIYHEMIFSFPLIMPKIHAHSVNTNHEWFMSYMGTFDSIEIRMEQLLLLGRRKNRGDSKLISLLNDLLPHNMLLINCWMKLTESWCKNKGGLDGIGIEKYHDLITCGYLIYYIFIFSDFSSRNSLINYLY